MLQIFFLGWFIFNMIQRNKYRPQGAALIRFNKMTVSQYIHIVSTTLIFCYLTSDSQQSLLKIGIAFYQTELWLLASYNNVDLVHLVYKFDTVILSLSLNSYETLTLSCQPCFTVKYTSCETVSLTLGLSLSPVFTLFFCLSVATVYFYLLRGSLYLSLSLSLDIPFSVSLSPLQYLSDLQRLSLCKVGNNPSLPLTVDTVCVCAIP